MPFFSVIIPTYNRAQMLTRSVESVLAQSFKDFELIIVDDGSVDDTKEVLERYRNRFKYIYTENSGVSAARNTGIRISTGRYIALLDSDDTWHREKLKEQYLFFEENRKISICQTEDIWMRNGKRVNPAKKHLKQEGYIFSQSLNLCLISPSSVAIERSIFDRYGMFDEKMHACEDYDMWIRITPFEKIGLIRKHLITRYAGHNDQLSGKYWGMDRFRLYSMVKLIETNDSRLSEFQLNELLNTAKKKVSILLSGAEKRDNSALKDVLIRILKDLSENNCRHKDYQTLLDV